VAGGFALLLAAATSSAQSGRMVLTPFFGGIIPTAALGSLRIAGLTPQPFVFRGEVNTGGALGGRVGYWVSERWGIEGSYFWSSADVRLTGGPFSARREAELQGGTLKLFWQATAAGTGTDILLSGGLMGIEHRGSAFQLASDQFDIGAAVGGGLHVAMSPLVTFRVDGDMLLYRYAFGPGFPVTTQADVLMTVGLGIRFSR
jgi:hypothetical protein